MCLRRRRAGYQQIRRTADFRFLGPLANTVTANTVTA